MIPSYLVLLILQVQPSKLSSLITEYNCTSSRRCSDPYGRQIPYQLLDVAKKCDRDFHCQAYQYFESGNLFYGVLCNTSDQQVELEYQGFSVCIRPDEPRQADEVQTPTPSTTFNHANQTKTNGGYLFIIFLLIVIHCFQSSTLS